MERAESQTPHSLSWFSHPKKPYFSQRWQMKSAHRSTSLLPYYSLPWGCKGPLQLRVTAPKLPTTLRTADFENEPPMRRCEFPASGMGRRQLSSLRTPLPVVRGVPVCASSPSSIGKAGEDCSGRAVGFGSFITFFKRQRIHDERTSLVDVSSGWPGRHRDCGGMLADVSRILFSHSLRTCSDSLFTTTGL